jgi:hypothetical protein
MNREYHSSAQQAITQRHLPIKSQGFKSCRCFTMVSHARFELSSKVPCKPCNYCISASDASFLTGEFSDFSDHFFYICVGLYVSGWVYRFPDARSRQTEKRLQRCISAAARLCSGILIIQGSTFLCHGMVPNSLLRSAE